MSVQRQICQTQKIVVNTYYFNVKIKYTKDWSFEMFVHMVYMAKRC